MAEYSIIDCLHSFKALITCDSVHFHELDDRITKLVALFCAKWITENSVLWIIILYSVLNGLLKNSVL